MPEFRRDPITGRWVIIDQSRKFNKLTTSEADLYPKDITKCPFCEGNESMTRPEILAYSSNPNRRSNTKDWTLRVIPNNKPVLEIEGSLRRRAEGMYDKMDGVGAHEIIVETPEHYLKPCNASSAHYENIYRAAVDRTKDLRNDSRLEYILVFKNYGIAANSLFEHPHSQLIAMPIVPKRVKEEIVGAKNYFAYKERCVFCDILSQEIEDGSRVVAENELFVAICPFVSRYPFETWIIPKNHNSDFDSASGAEIVRFSDISEIVFSKMSKVLDGAAYSALIHTGPLKEKNLQHYHWHMEIIPKLTKTAGFEWGTGLYINPVAPEEAAEHLRKIE